jgi:hypothetical protein
MVISRRECGRSTAGQKKAANLLSRDWVLSQFGENRKRAQKVYKVFVKDGIGVDIWKDLNFNVCSAIEYSVNDSFFS